MEATATLKYLKMSPQKVRLVADLVRGKKVEEAIKAGDKKAAADALRAAQPEIQRGAAKHIVTKNAAARRVSRLAARIKSMA